jgi:hypothetical protein
LRVNMKNQAFAVIATIALFVCFIVTLSPASANQMVVDVFIINQFSIPVSSITITRFVPVDIYAQVGYIESGTFPPSDFQWYVNGEPTKFENIGNSVYTFTPQAVGKYVITVTVNGETNSKRVTVTVIADSIPSPNSSSTPIPSLSPTPTSTPSLTPTSTPNVPEFPSLIIPLLLSIMLVAAGLLVYHKKHKHNSVKKV